MSNEDTTEDGNKFLSATSGIKPDIVIKPVEQVYEGNLAKITYVFRDRLLEVEEPDTVSMNWKLKVDEIWKSGELFIINWDKVQFIEVIFKR